MKTDANEIDEGTSYIGYREAFDIVAARAKPVGSVELPVGLCAGRVAAADLIAKLSYPSVAVSLKDGYAVRSADVAHAGRQSPVCLAVDGAAFAGVAYAGKVREGGSVKICSGAPIPGGSDAVVSGEFCEEAPGAVLVRADAGAGRNILAAGSEVKAGAVIARKGERISPGTLGLAAAAGISNIPVHRPPRVAIVSIGDEVVAPGARLHIGQLYASNLVTMEAWLASFGIPCSTAVVADDERSIVKELLMHLPGVDAVLTSGGAWGSERDLAVGTMERLGWRELFHYVRMGPGKGVAFGLWEDKPVFCLPGGPSSNAMAFLQLALPALLRMGGDDKHPLPTVPARLTENVNGRHPAWTEFKDAVVTLDGEGRYTAALYRSKSRMQAIAEACGLICVPEGKESLHKGEVVPVQLLKPLLDAC
ncbi:MAG: Molybdopterin molybdenumtransferase [Syntrophus sp. SKADARSKE-3]|nr:Molybdopterin molybdenumtransferase [Syntrophus sp. SKADARSKE-3]